MVIRFKISIFVVLLLCCLFSSHGVAQTDKNLEPIKYESTDPTDLVAELKADLDSGENGFEWDEKFGWLPSILAALEIPTSSQTLVFSKTSQQHRKISPSSPRALYFNDNVYVGFVQKGDFIEIASVDPQQGAIFYTVDQVEKAKPVISRASSQCLSCHESHKTMDVPGFLVRSVFPKKSGHPKLNLGTTHTDHSTPMLDRFGGWYVTGQHGDMRHRGNVFVDENITGNLDREAGANLKELPAKARPDSHLEPGSDIVALMLLEHQTQFHNHVTQASYTTRQALHHQSVMNKLFERPADFRSDTTNRRLESAANELVEYLFFVDEVELTSPIEGSSNFATEFESRGIRCSDGASLRDLDLKTRILKYPCSYLIYTKSFNSLPPTMLELVRTKMLAVLDGTAQAERFSGISTTDRESILKILRETHPMFKEVSEH